MSRHTTVATVSAALAALITAPAATAEAAEVTAQAPVSTALAAHCVAPWGSGDKIGVGTQTGHVRAVRVGAHDCFDRVVVELGHAAGAVRYRVGYRPHLLGIGTGAPVELRGAADLVIDVQAPAYDGHGRPTWTPANDREVVGTAGLRTVRQVASAGSFEGETLIGVGVRARLPFRAYLVRNASGLQLVVDIAHTW